MGRVNSSRDLDAVRTAGRINAMVHREIAHALGPGVTGLELDQIARRVMNENGAKPAFTEWTAFPAAICVSVNEQVGHGVPSRQSLQTGDLVKVDVGVYYEGWNSDAAVTHIIGDAAVVKQHVKSVTQRALTAGIAEAVVGARVSNISAAIYQVVRDGQCDSVRHAFGHGIGASLHEDPLVANFGPPNRGTRLAEGMVMAIEPVVSAGSRYTKVSDNGWTTMTVDGSPAAHFEHTVLVTQTGPEVLTQLSEEQVAIQAQSGNKSGETECARIRPGAAADVPELLALAHETMDPILMEAWGRRVKADEIYGDDAVHTLIAEVDEGVAGFISFRIEAGHAHVATLVVAPRHQRAGLGRRLMAEVEAQAAARRLSAVELWVQANNERAIRFYQRIGYERTGQPYFNTWSMRKTLVLGTARS